MTQRQTRLTPSPRCIVECGQRTVFSEREVPIPPPISDFAKQRPGAHVRRTFRAGHLLADIGSAVDCRIRREGGVVGLEGGSGGLGGRLGQRSRLRGALFLQSLGGRLSRTSCPRSRHSARADLDSELGRGSSVGGASLVEAVRHVSHGAGGPRRQRGRGLGIAEGVRRRIEGHCGWSAVRRLRGRSRRVGGRLKSLRRASEGGGRWWGGGIEGEREVVPRQIS